MKIQVNLKIEKSDLKLVKIACTDLGYDQSDFIRLSIRRELARLGLLDKKSSKILGVDSN